MIPGVIDHPILYDVIPESNPIGGLLILSIVLFEPLRVQFCAKELGAEIYRPGDRSRVSEGSKALNTSFVFLSLNVPEVVGNICS